MSSKRCYNCRGWHLAKNCPAIKWHGGYQAQHQRPPRKEPLECFACGRRHIVGNCPEIRRGAAKRGGSFKSGGQHRFDRGEKQGNKSAESSRDKHDDDSEKSSNECTDCGGSHRTKNCPVVCFNCGGPHLSINCLDSTNCFHCHGPHPASQCPQYRKRFCHKCRRKGHTEIDCGKLKCFNCGGAHMARNCVLCQKCRQFHEKHDACPEKSESKTVCSRCNAHHLSQDCPSKEQSDKDVPDQHDDAQTSSATQQEEVAPKKVSETKDSKDTVSTKEVSKTKDSKESLEQPDNVKFTSKKCYNCLNFGHVARDCPRGKEAKQRPDDANNSRKKCHHCLNFGHIARDCPRGQSGNEAKQSLDQPDNTNNLRKKCHHCLTFGHIARDCPKGVDKNLAHELALCFVCGKGNHRARDCWHKDSTKYCVLCHKSGHVTEECFKFKPASADRETVQVTVKTRTTESSKVETRKEEASSSKPSTSRRRKPVEDRCKMCYEYGHDTIKCPCTIPHYVSPCSECGATGIHAASCRMKTISCGHCHLEGHLLNDCPFSRWTIKLPTEEERIARQKSLAEDEVIQMQVIVALSEEDDDKTSEDKATMEDNATTEDKAVSKDNTTKPKRASDGAGKMKGKPGDEKKAKDGADTKTDDVVATKKQVTGDKMVKGGVEKGAKLVEQKSSSQSTGDSSESGICEMCKLRGHSLKECHLTIPVGKACRFCKKQKQHAATCRVRRRQCKTCGRRGHLAKDCPQKPSTAKTSDVSKSSSQSGTEESENDKTGKAQTPQAAEESHSKEAVVIKSADKTEITPRVTRRSKRVSNTAQIEKDDGKELPSKTQNASKPEKDLQDDSNKQQNETEPNHATPEKPVSAVQKDDTSKAVKKAEQVISKKQESSVEKNASKASSKTVSERSQSKEIGELSEAISTSSEEASNPTGRVTRSRAKRGATQASKPPSKRPARTVKPDENEPKSKRPAPAVKPDNENQLKAKRVSASSDKESSQEIQPKSASDKLEKSPPPKQPAPTIKPDENALKAKTASASSGKVSSQESQPKSAEKLEKETVQSVHKSTQQSVSTRSAGKAKIPSSSGEVQKDLTSKSEVRDVKIKTPSTVAPLKSSDVVATSSKTGASSQQSQNESKEQKTKDGLPMDKAACLAGTKVPDEKSKESTKVMNEKSKRQNDKEKVPKSGQTSNADGIRGLSSGKTVAAKVVSQSSTAPTSQQLMSRTKELKSGPKSNVVDSNIVTLSDKNEKSQAQSATPKPQQKGDKNNGPKSVTKTKADSNTIVSSSEKNEKNKVSSALSKSQQKADKEKELKSQPKADVTIVTSSGKHVAEENEKTNLQTATLKSQPKSDKEPNSEPKSKADVIVVSSGKSTAEKGEKTSSQNATAKSRQKSGRGKEPNSGQRSKVDVTVVHVPSGKLAAEKGEKTAAQNATAKSGQNIKPVDNVPMSGKKAASKKETLNSQSTTPKLPQESGKDPKSGQLRSHDESSSGKKVAGKNVSDKNGSGASQSLAPKSQQKSVTNKGSQSGNDSKADAAPSTSGTTLMTKNKTVVSQSASQTPQQSGTKTAEDVIVVGGHEEKQMVGQKDAVPDSSSGSHGNQAVKSSEVEPVTAQGDR